MQKSTGPAPASRPLSRVSAAIDGLCAAVLRNSEVTLPVKGTSVAGWPVRWEHGPPMGTEAGVTPFNSCERNVPPGQPHTAHMTLYDSYAHTPNECTVVVR
ncbi:hypothetical protein GCM10010377_26910 [Streptomyces viridiviolaceus]|nr:hypothetical protein GCM10010377_26910 [Streptomyces viridiviolaceus]